MNVQSITSRTFFYHQQDLLYPSILGVWQTFQTKYFAMMRNSNLPLTLGGDGRCDTPGHSAKYGSYTILDVNYMVVADIQLVQVNFSLNSQVFDITFHSSYYLLHVSQVHAIFIRVYHVSHFYSFDL